MIVSHHIKTIFIHVHRTGGSTVISLLRDYLILKMTIVSQHGSAQSVEGDIFESHPDFFVFGFVRNPWDRLLSWYSLINKWNPLSLEEEKKRFETFLESDLSTEFGNEENTFFYNQLDYFPDLETLVNPIKICRYENFEDEVREVFQRVGSKIDEIRVVNETNPKNYRDYYTDKSIELVKEKCAKDIEYFGYSF
jgi:hypothetical protein